MEYNSNKEILVIPEYGRHVQSLIRHAQEIGDRVERQHFIERVIDLMMQMHPQNKNLEGYRDKLWSHVFHIAEYNLDVDVPGGLVPKPEDKVKRPERVSYPNKDTRFKHYGNNVQKLIAKAIEMENGFKKDAFVEVIGSYMKLAYKTWNREHYVSDDIILEGLEHLSGGKLVMKKNAFLDNLSNSQSRQRPSGSGGRMQQRSSGRKSNSPRPGGPGGRQQRRHK